MAITPDQARAELARRELQRRGKSVANGPSFLGVNKKNLPSTISTMARPALEMGGAVLGGGMGLASPVPGGAAIGGTLGFAGGKSAADLLDRFIGTKKPLQNMGEAGAETLGNIRQGAENEIFGKIQGAALGAVQKPLGKFMGNMGRVISGVNERAGERLFQDPGAFLSPSVAKAGEELGAVRKNLGIDTRRFSADNTLDPESSAARKFVKDALERMQTGPGKVPLSDLVKGSQSMDDIIEATPMRQRSKRAELFDLKNLFTDELEQVVPEERAAARKFSRSALADNFRKLLPVTKGGDVSVTRTLGLGLMEGGGQVGAAIPAVLAQSPALTGAGIATAGAANKALQNPIMRRGIVAALQGLRKKKNENPNP